MLDDSRNTPNSRQKRTGLLFVVAVVSVIFISAALFHGNDLSSSNINSSPYIRGERARSLYGGLSLSDETLEPKDSTKTHAPSPLTLKNKDVDNSQPVETVETIDLTRAPTLDGTRARLTRAPTPSSLNTRAPTPTFHTLSPIVKSLSPIEEKTLNPTPTGFKNKDSEDESEVVETSGKTLAPSPVTLLQQDLTRAPSMDVTHNPTPSNFHSQTRNPTLGDHLVVFSRGAGPITLNPTPGNFEHATRNPTPPQFQKHKKTSGPSEEYKTTRNPTPSNFLRPSLDEINDFTKITLNPTPVVFSQDNSNKPKFRLEVESARNRVLLLNTEDATADISSADFHETTESMYESKVNRVENVDSVAADGVQVEKLNDKHELGPSPTTATWSFPLLPIFQRTTTAPSEEATVEPTFEPSAKPSSTPTLEPTEESTPNPTKKGGHLLTQHPTPSGFVGTDPPINAKTLYPTNTGLSPHLKGTRGPTPVNLGKATTNPTPANFHPITHNPTPTNFHKITTNPTPANLNNVLHSEDVLEPKVGTVSVDEGKVEKVDENHDLGPSPTTATWSFPLLPIFKRTTTAPSEEATVEPTFEPTAKPSLTPTLEPTTESTPKPTKKGGHLLTENPTPTEFVGTVPPIDSKTLFPTETGISPHSKGTRGPTPAHLGTATINPTPVDFHPITTNPTPTNLHPITVNPTPTNLHPITPNPTPVHFHKITTSPTPSHFIGTRHPVTVATPTESPTYEPEPLTDAPTQIPTEAPSEEVVTAPASSAPYSIPLLVPEIVDANPKVEKIVKIEVQETGVESPHVTLNPTPTLKPAYERKRTLSPTPTALDTVIRPKIDTVTIDEEKVDSVDETESFLLKKTLAPTPTTATWTFPLLPFFTRATPAPTEEATVAPTEEATSAPTTSSPTEEATVEPTVMPTLIQLSSSKPTKKGGHFQTQNPTPTGFVGTDPPIEVKTLSPTETGQPPHSKGTRGPTPAHLGTITSNPTPVDFHPITTNPTPTNLHPITTNPTPANFHPITLHPTSTSKVLLTPKIVAEEHDIHDTGVETSHATLEPTPSLQPTLYRKKTLNPTPQKFDITTLKPTEESKHTMNPTPKGFSSHSFRPTLEWVKTLNPSREFHVKVVKEDHSDATVVNTDNTDSTKDVDAISTTDTADTTDSTSTTDTTDSNEDTDVAVDTDSTSNSVVDWLVNWWRSDEKPSDSESV